jgi:aspartokinase
MEDSGLITLWTFENQPKLEHFADVLKSNDIEYEVGNQQASNSQVTISVNERDYTKAKKLLMKHRKRKTSSDYM